MHIGTLGAGILIGAVLFTGLSVAIAWTGPASTPPNGNVSAPINTGTTDQVKNSGLSVNALAVFGNATLSGTSRYLNFGTIVGSTGYGFRDNAGVMQFKNSGGTWINFGTGGGTGDISGITAGNGLIGGGVSGDVTLTVGAGTGITVTADAVAVDTTVVRTTGAQSIAGVKTFSSSPIAPGYCIGSSCISSWPTQATTPTPSLRQTYQSCAVTTPITSGWTTIVGYQCTTASCPSGYVRSGCGAGGPPQSTGPRNSEPSGAGACYCRSSSNDTGATCYTYCIAI